MRLGTTERKIINEVCIHYGIEYRELTKKWNKDLAVRRAREDIAGKLYFDLQVPRIVIWRFFDPATKSFSLVERLLKNYAKRLQKQKDPIQPTFLQK